MFLSWPDIDQVKALVWFSEQGQKCGRCGTYTWEWQYHDEDGWHDHEIPPMEADVWTCRGCRDIDGVQSNLRESGGSLDGKQVRWFPVGVNGHG